MRDMPEPDLLHVMLQRMLAERRRLGLPVRDGVCTCGNAAQGLSCPVTCGSIQPLGKEKP